MTEAEARHWVTTRHPDKIDHIAAFVEIVRQENARQNLIAPSTVEQVWNRHIVDSLQLVTGADMTGCWYDVGTGGGFPGMVVAIVRSLPIRLIEPRQRRATFLRDVADHLGLNHIDVVQAKAEKVGGRADIISARAVAAVDTLIGYGKNWATPTTQWILPRGGLSEEDRSVLKRRFDEGFHVEHSITALGSHIVRATGIPL